MQSQQERLALEAIKLFTSTIRHVYNELVQRTSKTPHNLNPHYSFHFRGVCALATSNNASFIHVRTSRIVFYTHPSLLPSYQPLHESTERNLSAFQTVGYIFLLVVSFTTSSQ